MEHLFLMLAQCFMAAFSIMNFVSVGRMPSWVILFILILSSLQFGG